ncbi:Leucine-rich repeat domain superfamily [Sesbania bispinosa]|nr:Leucine-rich repeat domain superfamily [Sesbania bispinosa]
MAEESSEANQPQLKKTAISGDLLSNLPDDLICHILCFLPTRDAYRTSLVSKRWRFLCTKVPDLSFYLPSHSSSHSVRELLIHSVNTVLLQRTQRIRKFTLSCYLSCEPYHVSAWISKALDLNVQELDLGCHLLRITRLPAKLSTSTSIVVLKLSGNIQPKFPSSVRLPSLKIFHLELRRNELSNSEGHSVSYFLYGCPNLVELRIDGHLNFHVFISLQFLKKLKLKLRSFPFRHVLRIDAPLLEFLHMKDDDSNSVNYYNIVIVNLSNVDRANLKIHKYLDFDSLFKVFRGIFNVKSLSLGSSTIRFLSECNLQFLSLPEFHNLVDFRVQISENCRWDVLVSFLQSACNLKVFAIAKKFERNVKRGEHRNLGMTESSSIPVCISKSLKMFEFKGLQHIKAELDFTRYIVENSRYQFCLKRSLALLLAWINVGLDFTQSNN